MAGAEKPSIVGLSDREALNVIGQLIDDSHDTKSMSKISTAFALLDEFDRRDPDRELAALSHYFRANAWASKESARRDLDAWSWEQPEAQGQILELRRAIRHEGFEQLDTLRKCQIFTNLANQLNRIGRFIEAIEIWGLALKLNSTFAMARGNRGIGLRSYAQSLYDQGHGAIMVLHAHEALTSALRRDAFYEGAGYEAAQHVFEKEAQYIQSNVDLDNVRKKLEKRRDGLGRGKQERRYRWWCLENRLFINPLNDLGSEPIAARDVLTLPSLRTSASTARVPEPFGFFNQMKQEFVSARFLFYEGTHARGVHFSDRDVLLFNTLDYPSYSYSTEKIRTSFRLAYSLFDKISFFVHDYLTLQHNPRQVSFRSVWYESKGSPPKPLLKEFASCPNWPLRGLFWLSKDLFEEDFQDVTEPDAAALSEIRNFLEHRYLQIHQMSTPSDAERHGLSISECEFTAKTLRVLKLVRAALIYLSLAVHREERLRQKDDGVKLIAQMPLDTWDDDWKQ